MPMKFCTCWVFCLTSGESCWRRDIGYCYSRGDDNNNVKILWLESVSPLQYNLGCPYLVQALIVMLPDLDLLPSLCIHHLHFTQYNHILWNPRGNWNKTASCTTVELCRQQIWKNVPRFTKSMSQLHHRFTAHTWYYDLHFMVDRLYFSL
jgi:hypothetical protein